MPFSDIQKAKILAGRMIGSKGIHGVGVCKTSCPIHDNQAESLHIYAERGTHLPATIRNMRVEHIVTERPLAFIQGGAQFE